MPIVAKADDDPRVAVHLTAIRGILEADVLEYQMGAMLRDYCLEKLNDDPDLYCEVYDRLATDKIISKHAFKELWRK
jgi:hypothetical protein